MSEANKNYTPLKSDYQTGQTISNPSPNPINTIINPNSISPQVYPKYIRKKWKFIKFKRMIENGNFISARLSAKALGVDHHTILDWLNHPKIQTALASDISDFTSKIRKSKDWKAQAYLLDKIIDDTHKEENKEDLKQLIVINT